MRKFASLYEIGVLVTFVCAWLFPIAISLAVSLAGYNFSRSGLEWQLQNSDIVAACIFVAFASSLFSAFLVLKLSPSKASKISKRLYFQPLNTLQRLVLFSIACISAYGLFQSFGGTFFSKTYQGAVNIWLGYGAWNTTFLVSLTMLVFDYLHNRKIRAWMVLGLTIIFLPFLLSGSRIDFLSFMLALAVYITAQSADKYRYFKALSIVVWAVLVVLPIAVLRDFGPSVFVSVIAEGGNDFIPISTTQDFIYLSTIGDLGSSVFHTIGLVQNGESQVGLGAAVVVYLLRLLPGPLFRDRPGDFKGQLTENVGGGALHSLGEGYLVSGMIGCLIVGLLMGLLIGLSVLSLRRNPSVISYMFFVFPWLLLIRGGWYQFFAIFKTLEILLLLIFALKIFELHYFQVNKQRFERK